MASAASSRLPLALAALATVAVGVLLLVPMPAGTEELGPPQSDKLVHVALFGGLALVWWRAARPAGVVRGLTLAAAVALYGGLLELLQLLTPYRNGDWWDFAADALGAGLATGLALLVPARWWGAAAR